MPAISVVIPARDAERSLPRTLLAVAGQEVPGGHEVIVVDNGSLDATPAVAEEHGARVIRRARGEGPGPARHDGVAAAAAPLIAFTDSDCIPRPGWLAAGVRALADADVVQGRVVPEQGVPRGPFDRTLWVGGDQGLYQTANLFMRADAYRRAGGFGAGLEAVGDVPARSRGGAPFGEDVLLAWDVLRAGGRAAFAQDAVVEHEVTPRAPRDAIAETRRDEMFPALVRRVPELRGRFLYRGVFLNRRHAELALAAAGLVAAVATRRALPLAAAAPLGKAQADRVRAHGPQAGAWMLARDLVSAAACVRGSVAARTLVL